MRTYVKNIISFIISLVLMFLVLATSFTLFFRATILNPKTYVNVIEKHNLYNGIYENIYENIDYLVLTNNMPEDTLDGVIYEDEIKQVVDDYIYYVVGFMKNEGSEIPAVNMEIYESRINEKIDNFLNNNSEYINDDFRSNIEDMNTTILNIIKSDLEVINLNQLSKSSVVKAIAKISTILNSGILMVIIFAMIILVSSLYIIIWRRRKSRRFAWIGYSFMSSGLLVFLIGLSGYISGFYDNFAIAIPYIATAISLIMRKCLLSLTFIGFIVLVIGLCFMSVYWKHLYKRYTKMQETKETIGME